MLISSRHADEHGSHTTCLHRNPDRGGVRARPDWREVRGAAGQRALRTPDARPLRAARPRHRRRHHPLRDTHPARLPEDSDRRWRRLDHGHRGRRADRVPHQLPGGRRGQPRDQGISDARARLHHGLRRANGRRDEGRLPRPLGTGRHFQRQGDAQGREDTRHLGHH